MQSFYLASKSPRRKEILQQLGLSPVILASNDHTLFNFQGDEEQLDNESAEDYVVRTARVKAIEGLARIINEGLEPLPVLSADTTVILDGQILGKPADINEARTFLEKMSGTSHEVRTAVFIGTSSDNLQGLVSVSKVWFKTLTTEEIEGYIATKEPYDKAGGYGIQGLAGAFIEKIEGSYSGIMGLPVFETVELLKRFGIRLF